MVYIPLGALLIASVTGVSDFVTWGQQDRFCWEMILHSNLGVDSSWHTRLIYIARLVLLQLGRIKAPNQLIGGFGLAKLIYLWTPSDELGLLITVAKLSS